MPLTFDENVVSAAASAPCSMKTVFFWDIEKFVTTFEAITSFPVKSKKPRDDSFAKKV